MKDEMKNFVKEDHMTAINVDLKSLLKSTGQYIKKEEYLSRLSTLGADVDHKLKDRPNFKYVKNLHYDLSDRMTSITDRLS